MHSKAIGRLTTVKTLLNNSEQIMKTKSLEDEWCLLQNQFDSYEKHSLYIKLLSIVILLAAEITNLPSFFIALILVVLWLQDAIWKTFQSRIEARLLQIERAMVESEEASAFQFNSDYLSTRLSGLGLINEYICQSIRPTVAFPHLVLIAIILIQQLLQGF